MWRLARHEEGFRAAHSGGQVILNMDFSLCIKIDDAVLIALAVYDALPTDGVDGVPAQRDEFAYAHAGRAQQVDQGKVSGQPAVIVKNLATLSPYVSLMSCGALTLLMRLTGLLMIWSSSSSHE